jgi:membrane-bound lytic murein transglycosylase MltF
MHRYRKILILYVIVFPSNATTKKAKGKKRRHEMSAFEEEMLQLHKAHLEARIDNERRINEKEMEILKTKHEVELQKLEILKKIQCGSLKVDLGNI